MADPGSMPQRLRPREWFALSACVVGMGLAGSFLAARPAADLAISAFFYRSGTGFPIGDFWMFQAVRRLIPYLTFGLPIATVLLLIFNRSRRRDRANGLLATAVFVILALLLGPGLTVNVLLKDHSGRARPSQVVEFGGDREFTPALVLSEQCDHNCSFVAGDPSIGFWLLSFALALRRWRGRAIAGSVIAGFAIGMARVAQGGHFASDVMFCGVVVDAEIVLLYAAFFGRGRAVRTDGAGVRYRAGRSS
jgi:lipid A 4'-phosphatase